MTSGFIYENLQMPGVYIRVDNVKLKTRDKIYLVVTWFRKDNITKKLINMGVQQDMVIPIGEEKFYKAVIHG